MQHVIITRWMCDASGLTVDCIQAAGRCIQSIEHAFASAKMSIPHCLGSILGSVTAGDFPTLNTYRLHCSSFSGLPSRTLNIKLVKPTKGTTMKTIGSIRTASHLLSGSSWSSMKQISCSTVETRGTTPRTGFAEVCLSAFSVDLQVRV